MNKTIGLSAIVLVIFFLSLNVSAMSCDDSLAGDYSAAIFELAQGYSEIERMKVESSSSENVIKKLVMALNEKRQLLISILGKSIFEKRFNQALLQTQAGVQQAKKIKQEKIETEYLLQPWTVVKTIEKFGGRVSSIAFSSDSSYFATASQDEWLRFWDTKTGELLREFRFDRPIFRVEFSPDGKTVLVTEALVTQEKNHTYYVDVSSGRILATFNDDGFHYDKYSPDGGFAAVSEGVNRKIIDLNSQKEWAELNKYRDPKMSGANFTADGLHLISTGSNLIEIWSVKTRSIEKSFNFRKTNMSLENPKLSPNKKYILAMADRKEFWLIDAESGEFIKSFGLGTITDVFYNFEFIDPQHVVMHTMNNAYIWNLEAGEAVKIRQEDIAKSYIHPTLKALVVQTAKALNIFDALSGQAIDGTELPIENAFVTTVEMSPDGKTIAVGLTNGKIKLMKKGQYE